ncbi:hypothetical protein [Haloarcula vallismortis]|uniref:hypothetical protein n=1 Tax=Haloarcula vallismortis TaxID=28442 RepID=UPI0011135616|nr:hypothetical protein [Haloarcula vallismortis]
MALSSNVQGFKTHAGTSHPRDLTTTAAGAAGARHVPPRRPCVACTPFVADRLATRWSGGPF